MLDDVSEIRYFQDSYENIILIWLNFKPANNNLLEVVDGGFQIHKGSRSADETLRDLGT